MKSLLILVVGLILGWWVNDKTSYYAFSCDTSKYGYTFIPQDELNLGGVYCYGNEHQRIFKAGLDDTWTILKMKIGIYK